MKLKVTALFVSLATVAFQLGNCGAFLGDLLGDRIWLSVVD